MKRVIACIIAATVVLSAAVPVLGIQLTGSRAAFDYSHVRVQLCSLGTELDRVEMTLKGSYTLAETGKKVRDADAKVLLSAGSLSLLVGGDTVYTGSEINLTKDSFRPEDGYVTLHKNGRLYLGDFRFIVKTEGSKSYIFVINKVPTVYYLYGVLAGEMGNDTAQDALKAQSLAAKSYVLTGKVGNTTDYDVGDTSRTQVYKGYSSSWNNIISAVNATANEVVFLGNDIMYTLYASSNGGETDIPSHAWGSGCTHLNPGYEVTLDQYDLESTGAREDLEIDLGNSTCNVKLDTLLMQIVKENTGMNVTEIVSIDKCELNMPKFDGVLRNMTNAHFEITAVTENGEKSISFDFPVEKFMDGGVFTNTVLRTYWGEKCGNKYIIHHMRNGHGVGLSQRAAKYRAMKGQTYREILDFYFPGSHIGTIPSISDSITSGGSTAPAPSDGLPKVKDKLTAGGKTTSAAAVQSDNYSTAPGAAFMLGKSVESYAYTKVHGAYMYSAPSSGSTMINRLPYGEMILVLGTEGEWVHAQTTGGMMGYLPREVLTFITKGPQNVTYRLGRVSVDGVNFRSEPSTNSTSYGRLNKNTQLYIWGIAGSGNEWYYVQCGLTYGYVYAEYVDATGTYTANEIAEGSVIASGVTNSNVNLRPQPSTNNNPIKQLSSGTYLLIYSLENGWYRVYTDGEYGYVTESYVNINTALPISPAATPTTPVEAQPIGTGTCNATNVKFRSTPDTSSSSNIICLLQRGDRLTIFSIENNWYYASFDGKKGYVYADYVDFEPMTPPDVQEGELHLARGITTGSVNFREGADLSYAAYRTLPKGTEYDIIGEHGNWYFIRLDGICGFISKKYAEMTDEGNVGVYQVAEDWKSYDTKATGDMNLRLGPSVLYSVIDIIKKGDSVTVLVTTGEWCLVIYDGTLGYCSHTYLER